MNQIENSLEAIVQVLRQSNFNSYANELFGIVKQVFKSDDIDKKLMNRIQIALLILLFIAIGIVRVMNFHINPLCWAAFVTLIIVFSLLYKRQK